MWLWANNIKIPELRVEGLKKLYFVFVYSNVSKAVYLLSFVGLAPIDWAWNKLGRF